MRELHDNGRPDRLPHGHSHGTRRDGDLVVKDFSGPDAPTRARREAGVLRAVAPVLPVPTLKHAEGNVVTTGYVEGRHGQDLLGPDTAAGVLASSGRMLARVHGVPVAAVAPRHHGPGVLVHGDFGPQNLLFGVGDLSVVAVLDWEWAHIGDPVEDLAWCEWMVRTHHPDCVDALPHLYYGYGAAMPPWQRRHAAMVAKCRALHRYAVERKDGTASQWQRRIAVTSAWQNPGR